MASTGAINAEEFIEGRTAYITKIMDKLSESTLLPTATEDRLFEEALRHVVHFVSSKEDAPAEGTFSCDFSACSRTRERHQCLTKILDQLCLLERKRLYDPPADNEIRHYLLVKKYTRSIMAFTIAAARVLYIHRPMKFGSVSLFTTVHHAEELKELNLHLADMSEFLLEVDIENVSTITPLMGTKDRYEMAPLIRGSKEKSYMFYKHKFKLASKDLRCSEFAFCPPLEDEERSYVQVLDAISSPLIGAEDEMNVYSEELFNLYIESIHQDIEDIGRHFAKIKGCILKNLSLIDWWETAKRYHREFLFPDDPDPDPDSDSDPDPYPGPDYAAFQKKLTEKCKVSNGDLPDYISQVDRCLCIARLVQVVIASRDHDSLKFGSIKVLNKWKEAGWEAVHALTLLKHGFLVGSGTQEQPILRNPKTLVPLENHQATRKHEHILHEKSQDENVVILEGIIDDLRRIGDSDIILDQEEMVLVHNIWGSVASSIHFFVSAMAYEQRRYIIQHYDSFDLSMLGLPAAKTMGTGDLRTVHNKQMDLQTNISSFRQILENYKIGLVERLRSS